MQSQIGLQKRKKTLLQEKCVLDHCHEADFTIERQAVSNNIKRKISERNINEMKEDGRISRYAFLKKVCFKNKRQNVN